MNQQELDYGLGGFIGQGSGQIAGANSGTVFTVGRKRAMASRPTLGASTFGTGVTPTICVVNQATVDLGCDLKDLVDALQIQADQIAQVWGTPCNLTISDKVEPGCWGMILLDTADQAGALGYHDVTPEGLPQGKSFVKTSEADNAQPSTVTSHELAEFLVDSDANTFKFVTLNGVDYAAVLEVADAVEADTYQIALPNNKSIAVSNWVYPSWFQTFTPAGMALDYMTLCKKPFELRPGGYLPVFNLANKQWQQLYGPGQFSARPRHRLDLRKKIKF